MSKHWLRRPKKRYLVLIASLIVGISYVLIEPDEPLAQQVAGGQRTLEEEPDSYGLGIVYKQFSAQGKLQQQLISARTEHYPTSETSRYIEPRIISVDKQGQRWHIEADLGDVLDPQQLAILQNNVIIYPLDPAPNQELRIETSVLNYHLDSQRATGDQPVRITNQQTDIHAQGFELLVPDEILNLMPQVQTNYAPPAR